MEAYRLSAEMLPQVLCNQVSYRPPWWVKKCSASPGLINRMMRVPPILRSGGYGHFDEGHEVTLSIACGRSVKNYILKSDGTVRFNDFAGGVASVYGMDPTNSQYVLHYQTNYGQTNSAIVLPV